MRSLTYIIMLAMLLLCTETCAQQAADGYLYAVLINGGRNRLTNHERYWNDCAFLYRTLRQTLHLPKRHITVMMSDGGAPGEDMLRADGRGFRSSSADLDGDGEWDVDYPADQQTVDRVLYNLSRRLTSEDHLFLFIIDHGGSHDQETDSFILLWADSQMDDYALASLLSLFNVASLNVVMGQCYSGGFISDLMRSGRIVATACRGDEQSWASPDRPYDEFVYHWICAVNGADETGTAVNADADGDGQVSMLEAFRYAEAHDRVNETPQYASWPEELGGQWTFAGAFNGTLGISERTEDGPDSPGLWTLSGQRRQEAKGHAVYILREKGRTRKIVR